MLHEKFEVEGLFRVVVRKANTGVATKDTGWFKNIITNYGMNRLGGTSSSISGCTVGTGTNPEQATDTTIGVFVARTNTSPSGGGLQTVVGSSTPPYFAKTIVTYRFAQGTATGNLTEVGIIANNNAPNYELFSRTLIKDESGNPITITVLPDEMLDVSYECRTYPQATPATGIVNLLGSDYSYRVTGNQLANLWHGYPIERGYGRFPGSVPASYNGPLSAGPMYQPSGGSVGTGPASTVKPYVNDSFSLSTVFVFPPGTSTGEIRSILLDGQSFSPKYALEFTPAFAKPATVELKIELVVTWSRRA